MIFGMQLTHYNKFDSIVAEIKTFRRMKLYAKLSYKTFRGNYLKEQVEKSMQMILMMGILRPENQEINQ